MSECLPFVFPETQEPVRTVVADGEVWFVAADACSAIGISKYRDALAQLDADERVSMAVDTLGGPQQVSMVNEPGLFALMLISRSPKVHAFRRWVTHDVLPSIRRTGSYSLAKPAHQIPPDYASALELAAQKVRELEASERRVAELEPAAAAWQNLATAYGDYAVADAAKILARDPAITIGRDRLFRVLADQRWIYRQGIDGCWRAYQSAIECGRMCEAPQSHYHPRTGELVLDPPQVRVTVKGLERLHRLLGGTAALKVPAVQPSLPL